ncbi:hypothetical protein [Nocardia nova]|uniref:hypothetical protein n=1 Tax=Nocardia nova TaxID=37330 RepID=UPI001E321069|nr:hypothetical protein [Nocardia nova]
MTRMSFERAHRTLADAIGGDPTLAMDRSDQRLSLILSARCARDLVCEVLGDDQLLGEVAQRSYRHSNGFDKITLLSSLEPEFKLRMHVWWPERRQPLGAELIHNHRWIFRSTMLCGSSWVQTFSECDHGTPMFRFRYGPRDESLQRYELKAEGRSSLSSSLRFALSPGSTYSMGTDIFHRVLWRGSRVSITMFVRGEAVGEGATVFSDCAHMDVQMLSVPSFSPAQLRRKLTGVLAELTSFA